VSSQFFPETESASNNAAGAEGGPVSLPREMFDEVVETFRQFFDILAVRMADGSRTTRMCQSCALVASGAHQVGDVTCSCVCHKARGLFARLEKL